MAPDDATFHKRGGGVLARGVPATGRLRVVYAWGLLIAIDVVLKTAGFARLCQLVRTWPTAGGTESRSDVHEVAACCAAVDRAKSFYFKNALCLQSSAAAVCLLRARGVRAELVIGVRKFPFQAHAWVEVDRRTVMDNGRRQSTLCKVIERC